MIHSLGSFVILSFDSVFRAWCWCISWLPNSKCAYFLSHLICLDFHVRLWLCLEIVQCTWVHHSRCIALDLGNGNHLSWNGSKYHPDQIYETIMQWTPLQLWFSLRFSGFHPCDFPLEEFPPRTHLVV